MFLKNLSWKKKNLALLIGWPVALVILWMLVFQQTFDLFLQNLDLKEKIEKAATAPKKVQEINKKLAWIDSKISSYLSDSVKNRETILHQVSNFCTKERVILKEFPQIALSTEEDMEIETNKIVTEGNFRNQLFLLHDLEYIKKTGRPASVQFLKYFDTRDKREVLNMVIYLQNVKISDKNK